MKTKGYIYCRQSSGDAVESLSIDVQEQICLEYANKNGIEVLAIYKEYNTSGRLYPTGAEATAEGDYAYQMWLAQKAGTGEKYREKLGLLLQSIASVSVVIVDDETRWSRPVTNSFLESYLNQKLIENHISIHSVKDGIRNPVEFGGNLIATIRSQIEHQSIMTKTKKSKDGIRKLKDAGYACGGASLITGYKRIDKQHFEANEDAQMIKDMFEMVARNESNMSVCKHINQKYRDGKNKVADSHIRLIVQRLEYMGMTRDSDGNLIPSLSFPAIISAELYNRVQDVLKNRVGKTKDKGTVYPMSGLLKCGICGKHLVVRTSGRGLETYYVCQQARLAGEKHTRIRTDFGAIERADNTPPVRGGLPPHVALQECLLPLIAKAYIDDYIASTKVSENQDEIAKIKMKLQGYNDFYRHLAKKLEFGTIDDSIFDAMVADKKAEKLNLTAKLQELESKTVGLQPDSIKLTQHLFLTLLGGGRQVENAEYRDKIARVCDSVTVWHDRILVTFKSGKSFQLPRIWKGQRSTLPYWTINNPQCDIAAGKQLIITYYLEDYYKKKKNEPNVLYEDDGLKIETGCKSTEAKSPTDIKRALGARPLNIVAAKPEELEPENF